MDSFAYQRPPLFPGLLLKCIEAFATWVRRFWEFILYSSLFLGAAAAGMACTSCFIQGIPYTISVAAVLSLIVFSVYNLNRKTDEAEDALNHERRYRVTKTFEKHLFAAAIAAYGIALAITALHGTGAVLIAIIPVMSGIAYSVPLLPKGWKYRRIKEIPVTKNLVVAGAWAASFSLLPVYMTKSTPGIGSVIVFLFIFSWTFVGSVLPDIRDRIGDSATGVATIPVLIGVNKSRWLLTGVNAIFGSAIVLLAFPALPIACIAVLLCSLAYSQACIECIDRTGRNDLLCDVVSDGQFLTIACICVLVFSFFTPIKMTGIF